MILSLSDIKKITVGSVETTEEAGVFSFSKCTKGQVDFWTRESETLGFRAKTTTGVRLDFHTDAKAFSFRAAEGAKFDLLLDGILTRHFKPSESEKEFRAPLPGKDVRVTLVFPSHQIGRISDVSLEDATYAKPHPFDEKILFIGDSITQGWNTEYDAASFAWRVALARNAAAVINGIGGAYFAAGGIEKSDFAPDTVIIAFGTNDYHHYPDLGAVEENARETFEKTAKLYTGCRLVALTPIWRGDEEKPEVARDLAELRARVAGAARDNGFSVIDGRPLVPPIPEFFADGWLHPNDLGFSYYAEGLLAALRALDK